MNDNANIYKYSLSNETKDKLKNYEDLFKNSAATSKSTWQRLFKIEEAVTVQDEPVPMEIDDSESSQKAEPITHEASIFLSSQFACTQLPKNESPIARNIHREESQLTDVIESVYESLENPDGALNPNYLKDLSDTDIVELIDKLSERLSLGGTYNLCSFICDMDTDLGIQYVKVVCSKLLLQKIIDLEEPSRMITTVMSKISEKFPEDIQKLIVIPMLNVDLKDHTTILAITKSYMGHKKMGLISDFLTNVRELKAWHIPILSFLIDVKIDNTMKDRLLTLLVEKATTFSKDKVYSKLILSFIKLNPPYSEEQRLMLHEIGAVNETIFKNVLESILKNMYSHRDLWHIS